jgi:hypothetical protein
MFDESFFKFLLGFAAIIFVAFGVMMYASSRIDTPNVDSMAHPR